MTKDEYKAWLAEVEVSNWDNLIRLANIFAAPKRPYHKGKHRSKKEDSKYRKVRSAIVNRMAQLERARVLSENRGRFEQMWSNYKSGFISTKSAMSVLQIPWDGSKPNVT